MQGVAATGSFAFSGQPANNSTISVGGQAWTFVTGTPSGNQSKIGANLLETLSNAVIGLNASAVAAFSAQTYTLNLAGDTILITSDTVGTGGNSVALASSTSPGSKAIASGSTLAVGSASGPYNHIFTSGLLTLPSAAIEIGMPDVPSYGMNFGAMADKLTIQLQRSGLLNGTVSVIAQGETRGGSSSAGSPTEQTIERFTQFTGQIRRDGVPLGNVVSGNFSYANGLDKVEVIRPDGRIAGADPAVPIPKRSKAPRKTSNAGKTESSNALDLNTPNREEPLRGHRPNPQHHQRNVEITSPRPDMIQPKIIPL